MGLFFGKNTITRTTTATTKPSKRKHSPSKDGDYPEGIIATSFFTAIHRAAAIQKPVIQRYVTTMAKRHSGHTWQQKQTIIDKHFLALATGSGLGTGALAAWPGIGTLASLAGIAGESMVMLELYGFYALASAYLRGIDISDETHRRTLVLLAVSGASSSELVQILSAETPLQSLKSLRELSQASGQELLSVNSLLGRIALRQMRKRFQGALIGKIMPFGVGAFLGARANRATARKMIHHVDEVLKEMVPHPRALH